MTEEQKRLWLPADNLFDIVGSILFLIFLPAILLPIIAPVGIPLFAILSIFDVGKSPYVFVPLLFIAGFAGWFLWKKAFQKYPLITSGVAIVIAVVELMYIYKHLMQMMQAG